MYIIFKWCKVKIKINTLGISKMMMTTLNVLFKNYYLILEDRYSSK